MCKWIKRIMHHNSNQRLQKLERGYAIMSKEIEDLKHSVELIKKAVGEAVGEIHSLADQLAAASANAEDKAAIEAIASDLTNVAESLHTAVYPPSSHVPLE